MLTEKPVGSGSVGIKAGPIESMLPQNEELFEKYDRGAIDDLFRGLHQPIPVSTVIHTQHGSDYSRELLQPTDIVLSDKTVQSVEKESESTRTVVNPCKNPG